MMEKCQDDIVQKIGICDEKSFHGYSKFIVETDNYDFFTFNTYEDNSGGYILRISKADPQNVVFFGPNQSFACAIHNHIITADRYTNYGLPLKVYCIDAETGTTYSYRWFSEKSTLIVTPISSELFSQDTITSMKIIKDTDDNDILRIDVNRTRLANERGNPFDTEEYRNDPLNKDMDYYILAKLENGHLVPQIIYPQ